MRREAVDHDDIVAARHALVQFLDVDPGRVLLMFDDLAERLAGHVRAREQLQARALPAVRPAGQHRHVGPAQAGQLGRSLMGLGFVVVHQHDAGVAARHQPVGQQFQSPQGRRRA
ncbi:hypothetical protein G6F65_021560 [Rhizopus arrhizus]|nr:hypothetical protein G6F65_021560 [Rhizopus arrhizus]